MPKGKGMQYNSEAPMETMMTGNLSGNMQGKPMKGMKSKQTSGVGGSMGGGERMGMNRKGKMGY